MSPSPLLASSLAQVVLAAVAALCGAFASGALLQPVSMQPALTAVVLAGAWQVLWMTLVRVDWQPARQSWLGWSQGAPLRRLPYTKAGSDADHVSNDLGQFRAWLREWMLPRHGSRLLIGLAAMMVTLVLATALGGQAVLLTVGVLVIGQIALMVCAGNGRPATGSEGLVVIGLPFALGLCALAPLSWPIGLACMAMGIALMALKAGQVMLLHAGSLAGIIVFVVLGEPAAAFVICVAWATGALLKPAGNQLALVFLCLAGMAIALMSRG